MSDALDLDALEAALRALSGVYVMEGQDAANMDILAIGVPLALQELRAARERIDEATAIIRALLGPQEPIDAAEIARVEALLAEHPEWGV